MRVRGIGLSASVVVALLVLGSGSASAASITFQFGGTITTLDGFTSPPFAIGDPFSLTLTADSADASNDPGFGSYATTAVSFFVGSYTGAAPDGLVQLADDHPVFDDDAWVARATRADGLNGGAVDLFLLGRVGVDLFDQDATAFASDALLPILSLDEFEGKTFFLFFCLDTRDPSCLTADAFVQGGITSVTSSVSNVPEPGTIALVGSGLLAFYQRRRRSGSK